MKVACHVLRESVAFIPLLFLACYRFNLLPFQLDELCGLEARPLSPPNLSGAAAQPLCPENNRYSARRILSFENGILLVCALQLGAYLGISSKWLLFLFVASYSQWRRRFDVVQNFFCTSCFLCHNMQ